MSRSLWTIAELAHRQVYPPGKGAAKNTLEEFVETAKDEYAKAAFDYWLQTREEKDLTLIEAFLSKKSFDVDSDEEGEFLQLDGDILTLPRDLGVFMVQALGHKPFTKTTQSSYFLFAGDPGERTYYRLGRQIRFPDHLPPLVKKVFVTLASVDDLGDELEVPDIFAKTIRDNLVQKYGGTVQLPSDKTDNSNPNT